MIKDYPDTSASTLSALSTDAPTAHSPYTPRQRRTYDSASPSLRSNQPLPPVPLTASHPPEAEPQADQADFKPKVPPKTPGESGLGIQNAGTSLSTAAAEGKLVGPDLGGASVALQRQVRSLDNVERIGRLLTLDLKGNEIRVG